MPGRGRPALAMGFNSDGMPGSIVVVAFGVVHGRAFQEKGNMVVS
jgi:hypothetical protein